jgi:hypothetical protein
VPLLLGARRDVAPSGESPVPDDAMAAAILQVERELGSAFASLDGWAEVVLARQRVQIDELHAAWHTQAVRIRDIDWLLSEDVSGAAGIAGGVAQSERCQKSSEARRQNMQRLVLVRRQAHDDLMGSLAWVRELVSMIHLAKFTGAPPARAEELVAQIAAAVEGLSEVNGWQEGGDVARAPTR